MLIVNLFITLQQSHSSVKEKWGTTKLKSANCFLETEKLLYCTQSLSRLQSNNHIYIQFLTLRWCSNNQQFHDKRQSWTFTNKQVSVGKLFDWSKEIFWSHVQHKLEKKSYKTSFKALPVEIQGSKNGQGGTQCSLPSPGADRVKE